MGRITLEMRMMDVVVAMSDGNLGALRVIMDSLSNPHPARFTAIMWLDDWEIYGSHIWVLYKNCCGSNIDTFYYAIRSVQLGIMRLDELKQCIKEFKPINPSYIKITVDKLHEIAGEVSDVENSAK